LLGGDDPAILKYALRGAPWKWKMQLGPTRNHCPTVAPRALQGGLHRPPSPLILDDAELTGNESFHDVDVITRDLGVSTWEPLDPKRVPGRKVKLVALKVEVY